MNLKTLKDTFYLLIAGLLCSLLAWKFWNYFQNDAFTILNTVVMLSLILDNYRLRKSLNKLKNHEPGAR